MVFAQIDKARTVVTVTLGSKQYRRNSNAVLIYEAANVYRTDRNQENLDALMGQINPVNNMRPVFGGIFVMDSKDNVYLVGTNVPVPVYLVERLKEAEKEGWDFAYLVNFWRNCLLCPYDDCRENLFEYCANYGVPITDLGYMVLYKAVTFKSKPKGGISKDFAHFVGECYDRAKKRKKGLAKFTIFQHKQTENFRMAENSDPQEGEVVKGNLADLHANLENLGKESETVYTDKWTQKMEIKLGQPVQKDHKAGLVHDSQRRNCSAYGVHVGSFDYVKTYANGSKDTVLLSLVNPKDLTVVHLGSAKMQTSQYFPIGVMEQTGRENVTHYDFEEIPSGYYESDFADWELKQIMMDLEKEGTNPNEALLRHRISTLSREVRGETLLLGDVQEGVDEIDGSI